MDHPPFHCTHFPSICRAPQNSIRGNIKIHKSRELAYGKLLYNIKNIKPYLGSRNTNPCQYHNTSSDISCLLTLNYQSSPHSFRALRRFSFPFIAFFLLQHSQMASMAGSSISMQPRHTLVFLLFNLFLLQILLATISFLLSLFASSLLVLL